MADHARTGERDQPGDVGFQEALDGGADVDAEGEEAQQAALVGEVLVEPREELEVVGRRGADVDGGAVAQEGWLDADERGERHALHRRGRPLPATTGRPRGRHP